MPRIIPLSSPLPHHPPDDNLPESASAAGYAPAGAGVDPTYDALTTMSLAMESPYANDEDTSEEALMAAAAALGIDVNAIGAEKK